MADRLARPGVWTMLLDREHEEHIWVRADEDGFIVEAARRSWLAPALNGVLDADETWWSLPISRPLPPHVVTNIPVVEAAPPPPRLRSTAIA